MKIPIVPLAIATIVLGGLYYLFTSVTSGYRALAAPVIQRLADLDGVETEVAIAPDGTTYAVISSGDLWLLDLSTGARRQLTRSPQPESSPAWSPDGRILTFTRGEDTYAVSAADFDADFDAPELFKANAAALSWSATGATAFVRDRALWTADSSGAERQLVAADPDPNVVIRRPRFSPDAAEIAFIRSALDLYGEVWIATVESGATQALVADRPAENPMDVGWLDGGRYLAYLTDRSGPYAIWVVDLWQHLLTPLTAALDGLPLERVGMAVWQDRIVLPRHFISSDIVLSDGASIAASADIEFEPAVSPNGARIAYTRLRADKFEIWTADLDGGNPTYLGLGREPRFAANGFELIYTHTDLAGSQSLWKMDVRTGMSERLTDAHENDFHPDSSPQGRTAAFASAWDGPISIWSIPTNGGKRLRLNDAGLFPRYSPDGAWIAFWNREALWTMDADGGDIRLVRDDIHTPVPAVWSGQELRHYLDPEIHAGRRIWPRFDILPDGRSVTARIEIHETALWAVDLTYTAR